VRAPVNLEDVAVARAALPALGDLESNLPELIPALLAVEGNEKEKLTKRARSNGRINSTAPKAKARRKSARRS
jgi:hypothetical protein